MPNGEVKDDITLEELLSGLRERVQGFGAVPAPPITEVPLYEPPPEEAPPTIPPVEPEAITPEIPKPLQDLLRVGEFLYETSPKFALAALDKPFKWVGRFFAAS